MSDLKISEETVIYGYSDSTAQKYAEKNGNKFVEIENNAGSSITTTFTTITTTLTTTTMRTTKITSSTISTSTDIINEKKGDSNDDGLIDVADVVAISAYVGNPEANPLDAQAIKNADVHNIGDGITANDALMVQQYIAKIIDNL
ncbi:MAG: hypothetical protein K2G63_06715 [Oscillospiraceae bacterium]|nr:hypothetical protein [Oscillospiraceae bacterium]